MSPPTPERFRRFFPLLGEGPASNLLLGRIGGGLFVLTGAVVLIVAPLAGGAPAAPLERAALGALVAGVVAALLPWDRWPRWALYSQTLAGMGLIALAARTTTAIDHYLPVFIVLLVFVGVTQSATLVLWTAPVTVAAFAIGANGQADVRTVVNFAISLAVGEAVSLAIWAFATSWRESTHQAEWLLQASHSLARTKSVAETAGLLEHSANELLGADLTFTLVADPLDPSRMLTVLPTPPGLPDPIAIDLTHLTGVAVALQSRQPVFVADASDDDRLTTQFVERIGCTSALVVPLYGEGEALGVVGFCWRERQRSVPEWSLTTVTLLAVEAGLVLERQQTTQRVEVAAATDPLTGVLNRRELERRLEHLRAGDGVLLVDVDDFKAVNDTQGHAAGDRLLQSLASCLTDVCRHDDWCGRLGGDEFVLILRGCGDGGARLVLADLHQAWRASQPAATISAGAAVSRPGEDAHQVMARADAALYDAKRHGRDRVEIAHPA